MAILPFSAFAPFGEPKDLDAGEHNDGLHLARMVCKQIDSLFAQDETAQNRICSFIGIDDVFYIPLALISHDDAVEQDPHNYDARALPYEVLQILIQGKTSDWNEIWVL